LPKKVRCQALIKEIAHNKLPVRKTKRKISLKLRALYLLKRVRIGESEDKSKKIVLKDVSDKMIIGKRKAIDVIGRYLARLPSLANSKVSVAFSTEYRQRYKEAIRIEQWLKK